VISSEGVMNGRHRPPRSPAHTIGLILGTIVAGALVLSCGGSSTTGPGLSGTGHDALDVPVSGSGGFNYTQGSYLEGFEFTANQPISVTALGAYDSNLSSLTNGAEQFASVPVALYDLTTHTQLAAVTVSGTDSAVGVYRYVTLASPIALDTTDDYSVAWVSLTDYYVAEPKLTAAAVDPAITYVAMDGNGGGGLEQTSKMVEPNWFFTMNEHGMDAVNYDLGPNFMFTAP
jgi:hypothetical protein